ncbi:hypothetical protein [Glaciimonas immobilis]|uniref:Uncharacterized protein n=1 Tax=Glaciimonas immobilis TaxID=728004 RepID=A0A840RR32_9BURK|nr:hypothetical protein [Glaciimonas immobilis]KAF3997899.1 hypothetical protein HAV38_09965 [Glaciimonas immobilis]MBB5199448.1 hypothetical protein [Glaciimonas immobilis]
MISRKPFVNAYLDDSPKKYYWSAFMFGTVKSRYSFQKKEKPLTCHLANLLTEIRAGPADKVPCNIYSKIAGVHFGRH